MRYKHCTFGCDRLIIKGPLLEEQRAVWNVSRLLLGGILCFVTPCALRTYKFGCDRSITKGTLLENTGTFSSVSRLLQEEIRWSVTHLT